MPIIVTIVWLVVFVVSLVPAMFAPMLFDAGETTGAWLALLGTWATVGLSFLAVPVAWIVWALTRGSRGGAARVGRAIAYLFPLAGIALAAIGFIVYP